MSNSLSGSGVSLESLVAEFGGRLSAPAALQIANVATVASATPQSITFAVDARRAKDANLSGAGCILMREADAEHCPDRLRWFHPDPYFAYAKVAQRLFPRARANAGIHSSAVVDSAANVDPTAEIGPFVFVAPGARVGARARLHAGVRLGRNCVVGNDSELFPNVTMYVGCEIGARAIVHAGVVIGADGFGFAPHKGAWEKIPQTGRVRIGDDVEIGANTTIDRGALDDTIIGNGVKLDNQIQIGHNCVVGDHTAMAGCVGIAGSTIIGKHCMIGGAARIVGHVSIVDGTVISAGTIVSDEIKVAGRYTGVFPTLEHSAWRRMAARVRRLANKDNS